jgi:hypothetical protein
MRIVPSTSPAVAGTAAQRASSSSAIKAAGAASTAAARPATAPPPRPIVLRAAVAHVLEDWKSVPLAGIETFSAPQGTGRGDGRRVRAYLAPVTTAGVLHCVETCQLWRCPAFLAVQGQALVCISLTCGCNVMLTIVLSACTCQDTMNTSKHCRHTSHCSCAYPWQPYEPSAGKAGLVWDVHPMVPW